MTTLARSAHLSAHHSAHSQCTAPYTWGVHLTSYIGKGVHSTHRKGLSMPFDGCTPPVYSGMHSTPHSTHPDQCVSVGTSLDHFFLTAVVTLTGRATGNVISRFAAQKLQKYVLQGNARLRAIFRFLQDRSSVRYV
jgi:hypothetical protein